MSLQLPPGVSLDQIPTYPPPPGVKPLQLDAYPKYRDPVLLGVGIAFTIIASAFVFGRVYLNCSTKGRRLWWDDAFAVFGLVLEIGYMSLIFAYRRFWRYLWDIPLSWFQADFFKSNYATTMLLGPAQFFAKGSILLLYLRLFYPHRRTRIFLYCLLALAFCIYFVNIPVQAYYCTPRPGQTWSITSNAHCGRATLLGPTQGALNVVLDIMILILPVREVIKLNLSPQKKRLLLGVFATGFLAVVASIVGLAYRSEMYGEKNVGYVTWYTYNTSLCIFIETYISLCCSSAPAFASLLQHKYGNSAQSPFTSSLRSRIRSLLGLNPSKKSRAHPGSNPEPSDGNSDTAHATDGIPSAEANGERKSNSSKSWRQALRFPGMSLLSSKDSTQPYDSNGRSNMTGRGYWEFKSGKGDQSSLDSTHSNAAHDLEKQDQHA